MSRWVMAYDSLVRRILDEEANSSERVRTFVKQLRRKSGDDPAVVDLQRTLRGLPYDFARNFPVRLKRAMRPPAPRGGPGAGEER